MQLQSLPLIITIGAGFLSYVQLVVTAAAVALPVQPEVGASSSHALVTRGSGGGGGSSVEGGYYNLCHYRESPSSKLPIPMLLVVLSLNTNIYLPVYLRSQLLIHHINTNIDFRPHHSPNREPTPHDWTMRLKPDWTPPKYCGVSEPLLHQH